MQLSWCIYQTRETKILTSKLLERKMQHQKKFSVIAEPRDLMNNNDRARTSIVLEQAGYYYGH